MVAMNLIVTCEFRFSRTPDNKVWTTSAFPYDFWLRYLEVFNQVNVIARVEHVDHIDPQWKQVCGANVTITDLPHYIGFFGLIKNAFNIHKVINQTITPESAIIYRVPSQTAMIATLGNARQQGFALEVVGDPYDVFNSGITHTFLDKILAKLSYMGLKSMANNSLAACYVTQDYLQQRYPVKSNALSVGCSDIELHENHFLPVPKTYTTTATKLVFIGSFGQLYKGPDILIHALAELNKNEKSYSVTILGNGKYLDEMKQLAKSLNCFEQINFVGEVAHSSVTQYIDDADVFVMPSRTEGLPRALIEAMARALPCIASNVGGIPELLESEFILTENTPENLALKIDEVCTSIEKLNQASINNLHKAQNYQHVLLVSKRRAFYQKYKELKQGRLVNETGSTKN